MNSMIQTVDLTKKFNDFVANDHINLDVKEQEIKCIVGENGAGKSTMMNMLYGLLQPTSGKILIRGKEVTLNSPVDAIANGIGMVHQHFKLVPSLTVYENILLGAEITQKKGGMKTPFIDQKEEIKRVEKLIQENHLELNATDKIEDISVGGRQRVEILKMLYRNVDILILDEPTAVLTPQEVDELIATLKNLKEQGKTIIVITHKLREVMELADSITVIKQGKVVGNVLKKDTSERELAQMMVGMERMAMFTSDMTAGRGFIAIAAIYCGQGKPVQSSLYAILFGVARSLAVNLSVYAGPAAGMFDTIPYIIMVAVLAVVSFMKFKDVKVRGYKFD